MIHNCYIIKKNGICIFHKKYGSLEEDPQSIAGFLTAISMFSKTIIGECIKILATNNFKFIFKPDDKFTFITFTDKSDREDKLQQVLENIKKRFYRKFPRVRKESKSGNLKIFERFNSDLDKIVNNFQ